MHPRSARMLVTSPLVMSTLVALAACADAPTTAPAMSAADSAATRSLAVPATGARALLSSLGTVAAVTVNGVAFSDVDATGGGWMERFNVYTSDQSTWLTAPKFWLPTDAAAMAPITMPLVPSGTPNSLADWAIVKQTRDRASWYAMEPMSAWHDGTTCAAPPATHTVASHNESSFLCRNHMMTAVNASGYGVTYLTPNRLVDFSGAEAVVRFDVATLRTSDRDWIDLWITPYEDNLVVPLDDSLPDVQGHPAQGLHVRLSANRLRSRFEASMIVDHRAYRLPAATATDYETAFAAFVPGAGEPAHSRAPSATRRDTFELRLGGGRLRFGMPRYNLWWLDVPAAMLGSTSSGLGVVQLGHHSFAPATNGGTPDTWHWDNVGIAPAVPFTILNADRRYVDQSTTTPVAFTRPAPAQARLRFAGYGSNFEVRFNGTGRWTKASQQNEELDEKGRFHSYWTSVPAGTQQVEFRASNDPADKKASSTFWMARDISIWSLMP